MKREVWVWREWGKGDWYVTGKHTLTCCCCCCYCCCCYCGCWTRAVVAPVVATAVAATVVTAVVATVAVVLQELAELLGWGDDLEVMAASPPSAQDSPSPLVAGAASKSHAPSKTAAAAD